MVPWKLSNAPRRANSITITFGTALFNFFTVASEQVNKRRKHMSKPFNPDIGQRTRWKKGQPSPNPGGSQADLVFDKAGNLYGSTTGGGTSSAGCSGGCGTVFELLPRSNSQWTEKVLYSFCSLANRADGSGPNGVILDGTGGLFGTAVYGGAQNNNGTVFELDPGSAEQWVEKVLYSFQNGSMDGNNPTGDWLKTIQEICMAPLSSATRTRTSAVPITAPCSGSRPALAVNGQRA
jgi:hypothetical protein